MKAEKEKRDEQKTREDSLSCPEIAFSDLSLVKQIGSGGFGAVWLGYWKSHGNRSVAIKVLLTTTLTPETLKAFRDELNVMHGLRSKFIVPLLGACVEPGHLCMVFEIAENGSVYDVLHGPQELPQELLLRMAYEAACGLCDLHVLKQPIWHRDIKSPNFLLNEDMRVLLADFGLARVKTETKSIATKTQRGATSGSVRWMAPEIINFGKYTAACDVFSFGIFLWELMTRETPYEEAPDDVVERGVLAGRRLPIPETVPTEVAALIQECWAQEPAKRPKMPVVVERLSKLQKPVKFVLQRGVGADIMQFLRNLDKKLDKLDDRLGLVKAAVDPERPQLEDV